MLVAAGAAVSSTPVGSGKEIMYLIWFCSDVRGERAHQLPVDADHRLGVHHDVSDDDRHYSAPIVPLGTRRSLADAVSMAEPLRQPSYYSASAVSDSVHAQQYEEFYGHGICEQLFRPTSITSYRPSIIQRGGIL